METPYRVLIIEDDPYYSSPLCAALRATDDFHVIQVTNSAKTAHRLILAHQPDVIVTDLILQEGDGFDLLSKIHSDESLQHNRPYIVVLTSLASKPLMDKISSAALADFIFIKGNQSYEPDNIVRHLQIMSDQFCRSRNKPPALLTAEDQLRRKIVAALSVYPLRKNSHGYKHLEALIYLASVSPQGGPLHIGKLYEQVGAAFDNSAHNIDMSIRRLLSGAYAKSDPAVWRAHYPAGAPKTKEFVAYIVQQVTLGRE